MEQIDTELAAAYLTLPTVKASSQSSFVLEGQGWIFNPAAPIDPSLSKQINDQLGPADLTWTLAVNIVMDEVANAHVGLPRATRPNQIFARPEIAKLGATFGVEKLNRKLKKAKVCVRFMVEEGAAEKQVVGVSGNATQTLAIHPTSLYMVPTAIGTVATAVPVTVIATEVPPQEESKNSPEEM